MTWTPSKTKPAHKAPPTRPGTPRKAQRTYTKEDKERYALAWILHGEVTRASGACGIPRKTCATWMEKAWWPRLCEIIRLRHKDEIEAKYEHILDKSTDELLDRIENGDSTVVSGKVTKVPVKAKELAGIVDIVQSNLRTSRNQPNNISVSATMDLRQLASNFAKAGRQYQFALHGKGNPEKEKEVLAALSHETPEVYDADFEELDKELEEDKESEDELDLSEGDATSTPN